MKILLSVVFLVIGVSADDNFTNEALQLLYECSSQDFSLCFKERALRYIENLPNNVDIEGIRIIETDGERSGRHLERPLLPEEPKARENAINNILMDRILNYLSSHTFEFKVPNKTIEDFKRSYEEEGRRKKKKGMNLLMLLQLKVLAIGAIMLKIVGIVAFKALLVGKIALVLVLIIGLKKLVEQKQPSTSYEVISHPHYDDHHHYDRSFSQNLAYRGYADDKYKNP